MYCWYNVPVVITNSYLPFGSFNLFTFLGNLKDALSDNSIPNIFVAYSAKPNCGWKPLNESKEEKNFIQILKDIVEPFKEDDGVCDIDMWYDDEDDMYSVYLVFGTEELNDKFTSDGKFGYVRKKQKEVEETIKSYLPIKNIRVGSYGTPHCGWKSLNESKNKSTKDLIERVLNDLVLPQYKHIICGFELKNVDDESLNNVINYPGVLVTMIGGYGTRMWPQTPTVQKMYDDLLDEIWDTLGDYTGISLALYSNYVKECSNKNIN